MMKVVEKTTIGAPQSPAGLGYFSSEMSLPCFFHALRKRQLAIPMHHHAI